MIYNEFLESGYRIFGLHKIVDGQCACGNPDCTAAGKHPVASNWQHTPEWSDEQIEVMELSGQLDTGYGVLVSGLLVVDVDARNGGVESFERLVIDVPEIAGAGLIVETGSGGGSRHYYFTAPHGSALMQQHGGYPGIDFKSSGFVVGPGSLHASGRRYNVLVGSPHDIAPAPATLLHLLHKPDRMRAQVSGTVYDYTINDLRSMVMAIPNDASVGHETYIRVGMGLHQATGGSPEAYDIWCDWAAQSPRHRKNGHASRIENRWHSFGKSANPVTIATLIHYAEQHGWRQPVDFTDATEWAPGITDLDSATVDLLRPPGFVGELTQWINSQSNFPRETLAVAAALMAVSNAGGMRYYDPLDNTSFNLFCFGVADSSTGKEAILQAHNELMRAAGIAGALVGGIKSEQEIYRNLVRHQAAYYVVDELGEQLGKITSARARGGAVYLEGVVGALMSLYSKSNSFAPITGDLKEELKNQLNVERQRLSKKIAEHEDGDGSMASRVSRIDSQLASIDMGLENPFLSIFGVTSPEKFDALMDFDMAVNGFMGRALIFREWERNPKIKPRDQRKRQPMGDRIKYGLTQIYAPGVFDATVSGGRVERVGEKTPIQTDHAAADMLDQVGDRFWQMAEEHKDLTGLHPIPRRGYELVAKISAILAIPGGLRTVEHVVWAYALVRRDIDQKMRLAHSNSASPSDALGSKILTIVSRDHGETKRSICRQCRKYQPADVERMLAQMVEAGVLRTEQRGGRGRPTDYYFAC
jgi:hypothetical protein